MALLHELVTLALHVSLLLLALGIGLGTGRGDALYVLRRPRLLLHALGAVVLAAPLIALLMVVALRLPVSVEIAIVLMAVAPLPPFVLAADIRHGGRKHYTYGLLVAMAIASLVSAPAAVALLAVLFDVHAVVPPLAVAQLVFVSVVLPLGLGMGLRAMAPGPAARAAPFIDMIANSLLAIAFVPILITAAPEIARLIGNGAVVAIASVVLTGLGAGHLLGGAEPQDRIALVSSSTLRHPGIAMLVAGAGTQGGEVRAAILLFVVLGLLAALPYQIWLRRHALAPQ